MKALLLHKKTGSLLCLLLCLCVCLAACTPSSPDIGETAPFNEPTTQPMPKGIITVPYTSLDSVNPFKCTSLINASLVSLVFRSLYRLDGGFAPVKDMAIKETMSEKAVQVEIDSSLVFSDAHPLNAEDIVYSFNMAKNSPLWGSSLKNISSCVAQGNYSVIFELKEPDINALNVLTFPIAKTDSASTEEVYPIGSGYYEYKKTDLKLSLSCNLRYAGKLPEIGTVRLYNITDSASLMHLLDTGAIDCFFTDLSDGTSKRTYSGLSEVYLNNFVFLGLNSQSRGLSLADVRKAVSMAIDRRTLAENAFLNHARASRLPFNISWAEITDSPYISPELTSASDIRAADALLKEANYGNSGEKLTLKLICTDTNSFIKNAAELIAGELSQVNIEVMVTPMSHKAFKTALEEGEYDMYLSEIKLTKNMDLSEFFIPDGEAAYGTALDEIAVDEDYFRYRRGEIELEEFLRGFDDTLPFVPLLFRNGQFCFSRRLSGVSDVTENFLFSSVAQWKIS